MEGTGGYLALVVVGVAITVVVGQILLRTGQPFLEDVFQNTETSHSITRLLVVLFHLLTLGVLGRISVIDIDSITGVQQIVFKIGAVRLIVGIAYGVSMLVLLRIRERRRQQKVSADIDRSIAEQRRGVGRFRRGANTDSEGRTPADQPED